MTTIIGTPIVVPPATTVTSTPVPAPLLPLEVWRASIGGYHPWHFWGWQDTEALQISSACQDLVYEYAYQNSMASGRADIRNAIEEAESRLREHLRYSVGRRFVVETVDYPRPEQAGHQYGASIGVDGRWLNIRLSEGFIRNLGVETRTLLDTATVVLSDDDGDGYSETFTLTVTSDVTNPDEIAVYFAAANRIDGEAVSERWRVLPVKVDISGTTITIKGRAWLLAKPILYRGMAVSGLDPATASNLVTQLEVYRYFTDPTGTTTDDCQAVLVWETQPYPIWAIGCDISGSGLSFTTNSRDPAASGLAIARAQIRDARLGEITVGRAVYDSDTGEWTGAEWGTCRQPDRVIVRYEAGAPYSEVENTWNSAGINGRWDDIVARFAAAELSAKICGCDDANRELYRWQFDHGLTGGERSRISGTDLENPFGTRSGHIYAWKRVHQLHVQQAFNLG